MIQFLRHWWDSQDTATRELPHYLGRAAVNFSRTGSRQAAALAYYAIFSIFPLSLLLAVVVTSLLGPVAGQEQIGNALSLFVPADTVQLLLKNVNEAMQQGTSFTL